MKGLIFFSVVISFILFFSANVLAEKIIITGQPIVVKKEANVYVPSSEMTGDYYYVNFGDTKRVCYKEVNPALANIDAGIFSFKLGNDVVSVHCYNYSPDYFIQQ